MKPRNEQETKKKAILEAAKELGVERFTAAEIEQIRRKLVVHFGASGKTSPEYVSEVLEGAGLRVGSATQAVAESIYEEEFQDLLHFSTLEEAEMCLVRLDELMRKFQAEGQRAEVQRVLEVARLGRRRAEMISRNRRVDQRKRAEKQEMVQWFRIWLETPDAFFDWLDVRKQSPEFTQHFGDRADAVEE
jgi:hypothetical protein